MMGTRTRRVLLAAAGCLLLAGCGPTHAIAGTADPATSATAANTATTPAAPGGGGLTACQLITEEDASTALGRAAGPGTPGGSAALSECIYDQGSLIVGMRTDSKTFYDTSLAKAQAKGVTKLSGVGDSAFEAGTAQNCTLLFLKGTTIVSILFSGPDAQTAAAAVAKVAAAKM